MESEKVPLTTELAGFLAEMMRKNVVIYSSDDGEVIADYRASVDPDQTIYLACSGTGDYQVCLPQGKTVSYYEVSSYDSAKKLKTVRH